MILAEPSPECRELIQAIYDDNFMEVQRQMDHLQNQIKICKDIGSGSVDAFESTYKNSQRILGAMLREKVQELRLEIIKLSIRSNDEEYCRLAQDVARLFRSLNEAKLYCMEHLKNDKGEELANAQKIKQVDELIEKSLEEMMEKHQQEADAAIESDDFQQTELTMEQIRIITNMLGSSWKGKKDYLKCVTDALDKRLFEIEETFTKKITLGKDVKYNPYDAANRSPKVLYLSLKNVMHKHARYQRIWHKIKNALINNFENEMNRTLGLKDVDARDVVKKLEQVLTSFPEHLKENLRFRLKEFEATNLKGEEK